MFARSDDCGFESVWLKRFEQVIERVGFKCADGVFVESGGEDDERQSLAGKFLQQLEAIHFRHLHVEENKVGLLSLDGSKGVLSAGTFVNDLQELCEKEFPK